MKFQRCLSVIIVVCIISVCFCISVGATDVMPRYDNASFISLSISFNGKNGAVTGSVVGDMDVSNIDVSVNLFYKNASGSWIEIDKDWDYNVNRPYLTINESFGGNSGTEYKVVLSGTVTKNGYAEPVSATYTKVCPSNS